MAGALTVRRRRWTEQRVDGVPVLVSPETGPAVVGLVRGRIVLPAWAVAGDAEARALVLEHEREHLRAGDPRVLAAGLVCAALMPWNPAVWWQLRRLRLAVEVDCDARVLRRRGDVRAYGQVLLEVGRRATRTRLPAAAFSEPASSLERRIRIMTAPRVRRPLARAAGLGALAALLAAVACEAPQPLQPSVEATRTAYVSPGESGIHSKHSVAELLRQRFPNVAQNGLTDGSTVTFVLSADGEVVSAELIGSPGRTMSPGEVASVAVGPSQPAIRRVSPDRIASVSVLKGRAGEFAPTPLNIILVQLKGDAATAASPAAPGSGRRMLAQVSRSPDGTTTAMASPADPDRDFDRSEMEAAYMRYIDQVPVADRGDVRIEYIVGADGKAHDVTVTAANDAMRALGNNVVGALHMNPARAGKRGQIWFGARRPAPSPATR
jgi:hypothetical protein